MASGVMGMMGIDISFSNVIYALYKYLIFYMKLIFINWSESFDDTVKDGKGQSKRRRTLFQLHIMFIRILSCTWSLWLTCPWRFTEMGVHRVLFSETKFVYLRILSFFFFFCYAVQIAVNRCSWIMLFWHPKKKKSYKVLTKDINRLNG